MTLREGLQSPGVSPTSARTDQARLAIFNFTTSVSTSPSNGGCRGNNSRRGKRVSNVPGHKSAANVLQRLKAALWFSVGKIVDEEALKLGINATPQFIGALTELLWAQIG